MEGESSSKGALIGAVIVILLLVAGGIYVAVTKPSPETPDETATTTATTITTDTSYILFIPKTITNPLFSPPFFLTLQISFPNNNHLSK